MSNFSYVTDQIIEASPELKFKAPDQIKLDGYTLVDLACIANSLGKATRSGEGYSCLCPAHNDHHPSGYISLGEGGYFRACCYAGCDSWDVVKRIYELGFLVKTNRASSPVPLPLLADNRQSIRVKSADSDWDKQGAIEKIWSETKSAQGTFVETYLNARIPFPLAIPDVLRFHPRLWHGKTQSQYRGMVARVDFVEEGRPLAIHRTFLSDNGLTKAKIEDEKKSFGTIKGGSIQLYEAGEILGVGEGIETCLSIRVLFGVPIWAGISASNMEGLVLPPLPLAQKLLIFIDNDKNNASLNSAHKLAQRTESEGRKVFIVRPPLGIKDFNDVLTAYAGKDVDARTLIESVDGKTIDFLFKIQRNEKIEEGTSLSAIHEEAYDGVFKELRRDLEKPASSECSELALQSTPATPVDPWDYALDRLHNSRKNLFITGAAGTGKSTLLQNFRAESKKKIVVVAPTGVAALNVEGQTIHRFFKFPLNITPRQTKRLSQQERSVFQALNTLIIDEVSMVRADLLDCIDQFLRKNTHYSDRPFGGVRVIMIGDPYQLPPVIARETYLQYLKNSGYETPYFFSAKCYQYVEFIELTKVHRQKDEAFITVLNKIRHNRATKEDLEIFASCFKPNGKAGEGNQPYIHLTTTNSKAKEINDRHLSELPSAEFTFEASVSGNFNEKDYPAPATLVLKEKAQIMMLNNDSEGRWVNGTLGEVDSLSEDSIHVLIEGETHLVERHTWRIGEYRVENDDLKETSQKEFTQYPLQLAWAITIHKSQGKTFDHAIIDLRGGTFADGQAYVALSRCTSLEGLVLTCPVTMGHIRVDPCVTSFLEEARNQGSVDDPELFPDVSEQEGEGSKKTNPLPFIAEVGSKTTGNSYICLPEGTGSDVDLARHLLHRELKQRYGRIVYDEGGFWKYGTTHWEEIPYEKLAHIIHGYDGKKWINDEGEEKKLLIGENKVKNTLKRLRTEGIDFMGGNKGFFNDRQHLLTGINCLNGFVSINRQGNHELIPHNKERRQRFTLPFHFKSELLNSVMNEECPLWRKSLLRQFLFGCFQGDSDAFEKCIFIMELSGVIASNYSLYLKLPKAILLYGESADNGKSQMLRLFENLLPSDDVCSVDPEKFNDEKQRLKLRNKKLNLVYELSGKALESHHAKHLITGDTIDARELYKMPVEFCCSAQHVWASNKLPSFYGGMDKGAQRRLGVLSFNRPIPDEEKIVNISQRIVDEEGDLLLAFAVYGAKNIISQRDFVFPPSSNEVMEQWKAEADPVLGYLQDCVLADGSELWTPSQDIYDHFIEYATMSGLRKDRLPALKGLIQRIKNNLSSKVTEERKRENGLLRRGLKGITLLPLPERNPSASQSSVRK